jgi:hypothetical protein
MELFFQQAQINDEAARLLHTTGYVSSVAGQWWEGERSKAANDQTRINTWEAFKVALRNRFEPIDAAVAARQQIHELIRRRHKSFASYQARFAELMTLTPDMAEPDRISNFLQGLPEEIVKSSIGAKSWVSLEDLVVAATRHDTNLRRVRDAAQSSGPASGFRSSHQRRGDSINHVGDGSNSSEEEEERGDRIQRLEERINRLLNQRGRGGGRGGNRGGYGNNGASGNRVNIANDLANARIRARLCINCGQANHMRRDCTNATDSKTYPAASAQASTTPGGPTTKQTN